MLCTILEIPIEKRWLRLDQTERRLNCRKKKSENGRQETSSRPAHNRRHFDNLASLAFWPQLTNSNRQECSIWPMCPLHSFLRLFMPGWVSHAQNRKTNNTSPNISLSLSLSLPKSFRSITQNLHFTWLHSQPPTITTIAATNIRIIMIWPTTSTTHTQTTTTTTTIAITTTTLSKFQHRHHHLPSSYSPHLYHQHQQHQQQ